MYINPPRLGIWKTGDIEIRKKDPKKTLVCALWSRVPERIALGLLNPQTSPRKKVV